ncbi:hypothetical protein P4493_04350 [Bacillus thuringiensis]|jgi:hypothetical protein|uniref:NADH dehydrogenase subunit 5 n=3 Tax=Bacillus thuringiensis TaxID=1428 RepID=A0A0B5NLJ2_BACTU|nr:MULTISPECIES: hypothetical protein [Bacillus]MEC2534477.1 hypothetical protein [Bacillus cereus]MED1153778.1 hypothetical protein [Bacillus paranthracis]OUB09360.1 NADH dehydrogenase [Bacillus thuringiensis serovar yunnanensis]AFQ30090.1 hypothetical protein BTF1_29947 [Bacillus thuringiensis HD-789]AJG74207.1 putative nADH dehydrogenase subunit 5 [Bacillus thuringiensis]
MVTKQTYKVVLKDRDSERMLLVEGNVNTIKDSETISRIKELSKVQEADRNMKVTDMVSNRKYTFILDNGTQKDLGILREHKGRYQFELKLTSPDCPVIKLEFDKDKFQQRLYDLEIVDGLVDSEDMTMQNLLILALTSYMGYANKIELGDVSDISRVILFDVTFEGSMKLEHVQDGVEYTIVADKDAHHEYVTIAKEFGVITAILDGENCEKKEIFTFHIWEALNVLKELTLYDKGYDFEGRTLKDLELLISKLFGFYQDPMFKDVFKKVFIESQEGVEETEEV